jgi:hypothetical protein
MDERLLAAYQAMGFRREHLMCTFPPLGMGREQRKDDHLGTSSQGLEKMQVAPGMLSRVTGSGRVRLKASLSVVVRGN